LCPKIRRPRTAPQYQSRFQDRIFQDISSAPKCFRIRPLFCHPAKAADILPPFPQQKNLPFADTVNTYGKREVLILK
jgi:hypothetical protein